MPTTLVGLLIFVALLSPGLAYTSTQRARQPISKPSIFRETALVTVQSLIADFLAIVVFGVLRVLLPQRFTVDPGRLIRSPHAYFTVAYVRLGLWAAGLLSFACLLAYLGGAAAGAERRRWTWLARVFLQGPVSTKPAWWRVFIDEKPAGTYTFAGIVLTDDTYVAGYLASFSPDSDETPDRELTLTSTSAQPLTLRSPGQTEASNLEGVQFIVTSARQIKYMTVTYVTATPPIPADVPPAPGTDPGP